MIEHDINSPAPDFDPSAALENVRERARILAEGAGYQQTPASNSRAGLIAPPGRFEGEPWTLPYFYDRIMNGDGDTQYAGEDADCDIIDVDEIERAAFGLNPLTTAVAVFYSTQGFLHLGELTTRARDELEASYSDEAEADDETEGD